jgi:GT2 family glycosyltransferase
MPDISFITVTMNSMSTVKALFESFFKYVPETLNWEYFVVDNCSTDGTAEYIAENHPSVRLVKNNSIKGFAENNNIAISKASGGIIALINPDIEFIKGSIENTIDVFNSRPEIGLIGPLLLNRDGTYQQTARKFLTIRLATLRILSLGRDNAPFKAIKSYLRSYSTDIPMQPVEWVIGAAMFARKKAIEEAGMLDTNFFLYIEDQDWCLQMWKHNWKVYYLTTAPLIHDHQRTSARKFSKKTIWHLQSILYFLKKNRNTVMELSYR